MHVPLTPIDESQRIAALQRSAILDSPPEPRFDRIARLAQSLFGVPIVLISLVDAQRQWFKARLGLDVSETSREISFCAHALHADALLLVTDARADPRFADNPLVTGEPHIRFYAGAPLRFQGHRIGTLCLIDREPRDFPAADQQHLRDLADLVEQQFEGRDIAALLAQQRVDNQRLRQAERALAQANALLERSSEAAQIGTWELPLDDPRPIWSPVTCALHEVPEGFRPSLQQALDFYLEGADRVAVERAVGEAIHDGRGFDIEVRIRTAKGRLRWVRAVGVPDVEAARCQRLYGLFQDVTPRRDAEVARDDAVRLVRLQAELVLDAELHSAPLAQALARLADRLRHALCVARASVWLFDAGQRRLACAVLKGGDDRLDQPDMTLEVEAMPHYVAALRSQSMLAVNDIVTDPAVIELREDYLVPRGIGAMLDAVIGGDSGPRGLLCCEHVGAARQWTTAERAFATATAVIAAQLLAQHERRTAMLQLASSESQFRSLVSDVPGAAFRCANDADRTMQYLSEGIEPLSGYPPDAFIDNREHGFSRVVHPDDRSHVAVAVQQAIAEGRPWECEYRICHRDGSERWVFEKGRAVRGADGELQSLTGFIHGIDARRRAEQERARVAALLQTVLDSASEVSIIATDTEGLITVFNRGAERMLGWRAEEMVGKHTPAVIHLESEVAAREQELSALLGEPVSGFRAFVVMAERCGSEVREWTYVRRSGRQVPVMLAVTAIHDASGRIDGFLGTAVDISAQRDALIELERSQRELRRFFALSTGLMAILGARGRVQRVNAAVCRLLQTSESAMLGHPLWEFVHPDDLPATRARFDDLANGAERVEIENRLRGAGGEWVALFWTLSRDPDSRRIYAAAVDVTERQRLERLKAEFISTVSHELRTPLTSINGALGLLANGALGSLAEKPAQLVKVALGNGQRLALLINDLLDMERLAAQRMNFDMRWHDVGELITAALVANEPYATERGVTLFAGDLPDGAYIEVDLNRFLQVMSNLLSNAAKFSPSGGVVEILGRVDGDRVEVAVRDDGPGIPGEFRARIFQKFSQADSSDVRKRGGTGLGLAITRELVESMGGRIGFESVEGEGSTFWVNFPTRRGS